MIESETIVSAVRWLGKFRLRLAVAACIPLVCAIAVFFLSDKLIQLISVPLQGNPLYFISPVEGFTAKLKMAVFGGLALSFPIEAYLAVSLFGNRMLQSTRKKICWAIIPFGTVTFAGGIVFAYQMLLPTTVDFLLKSGGGFMNPMIAGSQYVSFVSFFLLAVGLIFELPLVLVGLSRIGLVSSRMLKKKRKISILVSFIALAVLTPSPDAFTLLAVAVPVLFLYECSIWWIVVLERAGKRGNGGA